MSSTKFYILEMWLIWNSTYPCDSGDYGHYHIWVFLKELQTEKENHKIRQRNYFQSKCFVGERILLHGNSLCAAGFGYMKVGLEQIVAEGVSEKWMIPPYSLRRIYSLPGSPCGSREKEKQEKESKRMTSWEVMK